MKLKDIKTYVLLENGKIKNAFYDEEKTEMRRFEREGRSLCMCYDEFYEKGIALCCSKVIATSDSISELIKKLKEKR